MHIAQILPYILYLCLFLVVADILHMMKSITKSLEILSGRHKRNPK